MPPSLTLPLLAPSTTLPSPPVAGATCSPLRPALALADLRYATTLLDAHLASFAAQAGQYYTLLVTPPIPIPVPPRPPLPSPTTEPEDPATRCPATRSLAVRGARPCPPHPPCPACHRRHGTPRFQHRPPPPCPRRCGDPPRPPPRRPHDDRHRAGLRHHWPPPPRWHTRRLARSPPRRCPRRPRPRRPGSRQARLLAALAHRHPAFAPLAATPAMPDLPPCRLLSPGSPMGPPCSSAPSCPMVRSRSSSSLPPRSRYSPAPLDAEALAPTRCLRSADGETTAVPGVPASTVTVARALAWLNTSSPPCSETP